VFFIPLSAFRIKKIRIPNSEFGMNLRIDRYLYQKKIPWWRGALLFPLYLLSLPYGWGMKTRAFCYANGLFRTRRLSRPVISVGNITVGGTGKTPLVMALAKGLMERGIRVAVLSRGYRRSETSGSVVSDGRTLLLSPEGSGDEPYLLAQNLPGIPVLVGRDRFTHGERAIEQFGVRGLVLDDGFQHLQLHRDLDIALLDSQTGVGGDYLLPRGILREPLTHLRRADLVLFTKVEHIDDCSSLEAEVRRIQPSVSIFHSSYEAATLVGQKGEKERAESFRGKKVFAFSGIAQPESFTLLLRKLGMEVVKETAFPDHYNYTMEDLLWIEKESKAADGVVTTEKDMVKLPNLSVTQPPIWALHIEMKIWEEKEFFQRVMEVFSPSPS
jgi:tetraacyldisaccharide 4'-kinase